ncbi:MAG: cation:proton antiporter [Bdellovibrionales bacterium]|nr:cation:proton antiporter [Bdellovibrionales bacterium]
MPVLDMLALLAVALLIAKFAGGLAERVGIPSVLAELLTGILIGNLGGALGHSYHDLEHSELVHGLSELGVLFLLFLVGLETSLKEIGRVGTDATLVAVMGVIAPFVLAFATIPFLLPHSTFNHTLFMAAALTATSVGITARVLQDSNRLKSVSGQIILGAAVIDDILGVVILTVVAALVREGTVSAMEVGHIFLNVGLFGLLVFLLRKYVFNGVIGRFHVLEISGTLTIFLLSLCLLFAWGAKYMGLEGIIGAFALGIALDDVYFERFSATKHYGVEELLKPVADFFTPIFFIVMGMGVKLKELFNVDALGLGLLLIVCAIVGKLVCGFGVRKASRERGGDRLLVGFGMIPRGEVGLIFAAIGQQTGVLNTADYSSVVLMVVVTTLLAPGLIAWRVKRLPA